MIWLFDPRGLCLCAVDVCSVQLTCAVCLCAVDVCSVCVCSWRVQCVCVQLMCAVCLKAPLVLFSLPQAGQSSTVIENIHTIIAAAAVKFNFDQLSHLFVLIQKVRGVCVCVCVCVWDMDQSSCVCDTWISPHVCVCISWISPHVCVLDMDQSSCMRMRHGSVRMYAFETWVSLFCLVW